MQTLLPLAVLLVCLASSVLSETPLSYDLIDTELVHLGVDPRASVLSRFPDEKAKLLARAGANRLNGCYKVFPGQKNIFQDPMRSVIYEYLTFQSFSRTQTSAIALRQLVRNLNTNIPILAEYILDCVANNDPNFEPTTFGLTKFTAMSTEELAVFFQPQPGYNKTSRSLDDEENFTTEMEPNLNITFPEHFDYRDRGVVSPVKDQGRCGTCFIFSIIAAMESAYMLKHNTTGIVFSEAELLNCLWGFEYYRNSTCESGGSTSRVIDKIPDFNGVTFQNHSEPYQPGDVKGSPYPFHPDRCARVPKDGQVIHHYRKHFSGEENQEQLLKAVLMQYGPVVIGYRANWLKENSNSPKFGHLVGPQHHPCDPDSASLHAMTVVGWNEKYYIIKNSYGNYKNDDGPKKKPWGVEGYLYLRKDLALGCGLFNLSWDLPVMK